MSFLRKFLAFVAIIIAIGVASDQFKDQLSIFDEKVLGQVVNDVIQDPKYKTTDSKFLAIRDKLASIYPGHINDEEQWVFNNAGGAMGSMMLLHTSLTEYVIIFGTAIGTEGHTGRFWADDYFTIIDGEQWAFSEGSSERLVFKPGDQHHLAKFTAKAYRCPDHCWALEYARGVIPFMLPFGFADSFFSTLDFVPVVRTVYLYARLVISELVQGKI